MSDLRAFGSWSPCSLLGQKDSVPHTHPVIGAAPTNVPRAAEKHSEGALLWEICISRRTEEEAVSNAISLRLKHFLLC